MALDIEKPRRHHAMRRVDAFARAGVAQQTPRGDARNAIAPDAHIAVEPGGSGTVHDAPVLDDYIVRAIVRRRASRLTWCTCHDGGKQDCDSRDGARTSHLQFSEVVDTTEAQNSVCFAPPSSDALTT